MAEPSQQHLAEDLEREWVCLFNEPHRAGKRPSAALNDAIDIFLIEVETLLYLVAYEKHSLAGARRPAVAGVEEVSISARCCPSPD
ncbi:hypothetical protein AWB64_05275 [Caballeronia sordidicola]|uniref:Uncharacterized protein n=1 Tax=Caballeronia sordidicola TaxID=196367 RepID=A0A158I0I3_CABSO|nr:hypothetical protein [Caballeronia sordidicola]SAL50066.1 hypothetical protein AWB64_05275 [Caballeronia sordidicola]